MKENTVTPTAHRPTLRMPRALLYVFLIALAITYIFPFIWIVLSSLKAPSELIVYPPKLFPATLRWSNYQTVFKEIKIGQMFVNSLIVSLSVTAGQLIFCSLAGYSFAKLRFPGRDKLFKLYLATMMVPGTVTLIPMYVIFVRLGLVNSFAGLILPGFFGGAFGVFLTRQFFMTLPNQLGEAAVIDGAGYGRVFLRVYLPLITPILATLGIFSFMGAWNDFLWPLIVIQSSKLKTLTVGLASFQGLYGAKFNLLMAGAVLSILPVLVAFLCAQRYFIEGIALSGMKS